MQPATDPFNDLFHKEYSVREGHGQSIGLLGAVAYFFLTGPALAAWYYLGFGDAPAQSPDFWQFLVGALALTVAHIVLFVWLYRRTRLRRLILTVREGSGGRNLLIQYFNGARLRRQEIYSSTTGRLELTPNPREDAHPEGGFTIEQIVRPQSNGRETVLREQSAAFMYHPISLYDLSEIVRLMNGPAQRKHAYIPPPDLSVPRTQPGTTATASVTSAAANSRVGDSPTTAGAAPPSGVPVQLYNKTFRVSSSAWLLLFALFFATGACVVLPTLQWLNTQYTEPDAAGQVNNLSFLLRAGLVIAADIALWVLIYRLFDGQHMQITVNELSGVRYLQIQRLRWGKRILSRRVVPEGRIHVAPEPTQPARAHDRTAYYTRDSKKPAN